MSQENVEVVRPDSQLRMVATFQACTRPTARKEPIKVP
jgi:hypothetical protein